MHFTIFSISFNHINYTKFPFPFFFMQLFGNFYDFYCPGAYQWEHCSPYQRGMIFPFFFMNDFSFLFFSLLLWFLFLLDSGQEDLWTFYFFLFYSICSFFYRFSLFLFGSVGFLVSWYFFFIVPNQSISFVACTFIVQVLFSVFVCVILIFLLLFYFVWFFFVLFCLCVCVCVGV